jgi:hypothetical protein
MTGGCRVAVTWRAAAGANFPAVFPGLSDVRQLLPCSMRPQLLKNSMFRGFVAWHAFCSAPEVFPEFAMSVSFPSAVFPPTFPSTSSPASQPTSTGLATKPTNSVVQQFLQYANMTPAQRMQADMLSQLGLTEDQFKAMSPADQQKVEAKIRDLVKKQADESNDKRTGLITDISV